MLTVLEVIKRTTEFLEKRGVESARLNAECLLGHALGLPRMQLYLQFERPLTEAELERIRPLVRRRGSREPLQYILGAMEFGGVKLKVDRRALIPRPETELLVDLIRQKLPAPPPDILDLGTGSGAIALALATIFPEARVTAVDSSPEALALARENAEAAGLGSRIRLVASDWFKALPADGKFGLIVANPPYLSDAETMATAAEVKEFEPRQALSAGVNGAAALELIVGEAGRYLVAGGLLACETGLGQHAALQELAKRSGFVRTESLPDLTGRDRFLLAFR